MEKLTPEMENQLRELRVTLEERHDQLKGYINNPFLEKPIAIPDTCDRCLVNIKSVVSDCEKIMIWAMHAIRKEALDDAKKEVLDLFIPGIELSVKKELMMKALEKSKIFPSS